MEGHHEPFGDVVVTLGITPRPAGVGLMARIGRAT